MPAASTTPDGRRAIVTGAAGGIGRAIVEALASADCRVAACDVPGTPLEEVAGATATGAFDVRDRVAVQAGVAEAVEAMGGCDTVVANAGLVDTIHRAEEFPPEAWSRDLETNLTGAFNVVQAAFGALAESDDGRIVLISSLAAETGLPGQVAYAASKAGVVGMARTLAAEWAPHGVRCNVVMPGLIATPKVLAMPEQMRSRLARGIPLRRFGTPAELAGAVSYLLSPAAAFVTGAVLRVDGGTGLQMSGLVG